MYICSTGTNNYINNNDNNKVPQNWMINCYKMYKISHEVITFIEKTMKAWKVELTAGGRSLAEAKIQRGIFQRDALSPLVFIIAMMPLKQSQKMHSRIQTYEITGKDQSHNVHEQHETVCKNEKRTGNINVHSENIQSGHRDRIFYSRQNYLAETLLKE